MDSISPADLGITQDPGTRWHPRRDKHQARRDDGNLRDLTTAEVVEHQAKPEADDQPDASRGPLGAEDSTETPEGVV